MDTNKSVDSPDISLEQFDASIQETLNRLIDGGRIHDQHRESAAEFRRRLEGLQRRLRAGRGVGGRAEMPADAKGDYDLLAWDFKRWIAEIDQDFENRDPQRPAPG